MNWQLMVLVLTPSLLALAVVTLALWKTSTSNSLLTQRVLDGNKKLLDTQRRLIDTCVAISEAELERIKITIDGETSAEWARRGVEKPDREAIMPGAVFGDPEVGADRYDDVEIDFGGEDGVG